MFDFIIKIAIEAYFFLLVASMATVSFGELFDSVLRTACNSILFIYSHSTHTHTDFLLIRMKFFLDNHGAQRCMCTDTKSHNSKTNEKCSSFELEALRRYVIVR